VSRWAPTRVSAWKTAALDLFVENGYEETTVAQIADRAGLNRATFFRHFADKREVLFGGEDVLAGLFADGIRPPPRMRRSSSVCGGVTAADVAMTPQQRAKAAQRVRWRRRTAKCRSGDCSSTPGSPDRSVPPCASGAPTS
jgi:AcrR family transcriptional regulator